MYALTFFSELTNKEIKNVICFHSFIYFLDTNIFQLGLHVVHSGSAYTHLLVNLRLLLPLESQKENPDDENPDDAKNLNSLER